jgi:VWFA-related protein
MKLRPFQSTLLWMALIGASGTMAQSQTVPAAPTIKVKSALVFLDVTVLDKKGHSVVRGLTKNDFIITEDKIPQTIFSFEAPEVHVIGGDENPDGKAPTTILVMDLLNSNFEDFGYIRYETAEFLKAQPSQLASPTELLVVGNESLEVQQSFTRSRADLLDAVSHAPPAIPYKEEHGDFAWERFAQSLGALDQITLQSRGVPGRKNIVWIGRGGPSVYLNPAVFPRKSLDKLRDLQHWTTNMLVDARISLFVIYPGLPAQGGGTVYTPPQPNAAFPSAAGFPAAPSTPGIDLQGDDPFAGDIDFGLFASETGGKLFYNRNDVAAEIKESEAMGAQYYTLTYQPQNGDSDGKFRRIRVTLGDPNLVAVTKAGYYAPDAHSPISPQHQAMLQLAEAVRSPITFDALEVSISSLVRHPDTQTADFTVQLKSKNLDFEASENGSSVAEVILAAASLNQYGNILTSKIKTFRFVTQPEDLDRLPDVVARFLLQLRVPRETRRVRVIIQANEDGRMGSAEMDRKMVDIAPAMPTPTPN